MGRLSGHPNIVNILGIGATPSGRPFIVMQYHPHDSLDALIRKRGPLDWRDALRLGVKLAGALETAHRSGTLHRDVKPANILLTEYGEPQLTDFGIARLRAVSKPGPVSSLERPHSLLRKCFRARRPRWLPISTVSVPRCSVH